MAAHSYVHHFEPGPNLAAPPAAASAKAPPPLLLLHGTGGNEQSLLPLGHALSPGSPLLSPRGQVSENGALRFFRRHAEGVLGLDDLAARAHEMADFAAGTAKAKSFDATRLVAVGFSNGANLAAAMLLRRPASLAAAILIRPMLGLDPSPAPDLAGKRVLILSGANDPIVPAGHPEQLEKIFRAAGAEVERHSFNAGHGLTQADITAAKLFLTSNPL